MAYQQAASYRGKLDDALKKITSQTDALDKQLDNVEAEYERLSSTLQERNASWFTAAPPFLGKKWLEIPILDAFNSPLKIDNLWTKNLTIPNGSFGEVTRFDRCTTCHKAIDKTAPGSAVNPLYEDLRVVELLMPTPDQRPVAEEGEEQPTLQSVYGISVAGEGLIDSDDVAIRHILPNSLAALAQNTNSGEPGGLRVGDVLSYVRDSKVLSTREAERYLLEDVEFGAPVRIRVTRGLPQPYSSHPRLDLFVGSLSPHQVAVFGCSVCHEGQGSATDFKFVSHTPDSAEQQERWTKDYGWFNNHHWIYPMLPSRFAESSCLKCHHDVVELQVASQFDEPPAPTLTHGYELIKTYGCFGCHEINGYNGPDNRLGPDMPTRTKFLCCGGPAKSRPQLCKAKRNNSCSGRATRLSSRAHRRPASTIGNLDRGQRCRNPRFDAGFACTDRRFGRCGVAR